jgi:hypothetical protein
MSQTNNIDVCQEMIFPLLFELNLSNNWHGGVAQNKDVPDYQAHPEFLIFEFFYDAIKRCIPTNARIIRILASTAT